MGKEKAFKVRRKGNVVVRQLSDVSAFAIPEPLNSGNS